MFEETILEQCFFENKEYLLKTLRKNSIKLSKCRIFEIKISGLDEHIDYITKKLKGFILDSFFGKNIIYEENENSFYIIFSLKDEISFDSFMDIKYKLEQNSYIRINIKEIPEKVFSRK